MRVLITGGAGFIGSALSRILADQNEVLVLDDLSSGKRENLSGVPVELVEGSILDGPLVADLITGVDIVFHLACKGVRHSIHDPIENHRVNAEGTLLLLETARQAEVRRFVYTSTSEIYGTATTVPMSESHPARPHTVYGASKLAGEAYSRAYHLTYGLETVVIRPFNSFGPRSHHEGDSGEVIPKFVIRAMNGLPPIIFGDGSQTRDFTYVDDTARGIAAAGSVDSLGGMTINLGSGSEVRIDELARIVLTAVERLDLEPLHDDPRPGDVHRLIADARRAGSTMSWAPKTSLEEGIRRLIDWYQKQDRDFASLLAEDQVRNWQPTQ